MGVQINAEPWRGWKCIWKLHVQQWIKTFLWTLAHDRLLTNQGSWRRRMTNSPACPRCSCAVEDALHMLRDCPPSKEVWVRTWPTAFIPEFFSLHLHEWLLKSLSLNSRPRAMGEGSWSERMAITMWNLWKWRNLEVFRKGVMPLHQRWRQSSEHAWR